MDTSSANLNKIMFGIGALIILVMVVSTASTSMQRRKVEKQCRDGDIDVCTKLIESKALSSKELLMAHAIRGYYYDKKGEYDKALDDYNEDIKMSAQEPALYLQRAGVYADKSDFNNAIPDFNTAIKLARTPRIFLAGYCGRGMAEIKKGDITAARNDLQQAKNVARGAKMECVAQLDQALGQLAPSAGTP